MSDDALSKDEIDKLLDDREKAEFERRKKAVIRDIKELGILDIDIHGGRLNLDAIEAVIKVIKQNEDLLYKNAGEVKG